jgi:hypothetical protein
VTRLVWLPALAGTLLAAAGARADVTYHLEPLVGAGATDNARITTAGEERVSDSYTIAGGNMRLIYRRARMTLTAGYQGAYTQYLREGAFSTFTNNLGLRSAFDLSALWKLGFGVNGTLTRASGLNPLDPTVVTPQAAVAGSTLYLGTGASQDLAYEPTPREGYTETLSVTQLRYLESVRDGVPLNLPTTTFIGLGLLGFREVGLNRYSLELSVGDSFRESPEGAPSNPNADGHTLIGRLMAGWRRELSPVWATSLQAGPAVIVRLDGTGVMAPAFVGSLDYKRLPWYASLTALQSPAPNLFLGTATISDQVIARLALPLTQSERLFVGGYGGYIYARIADDQQALVRVYDQIFGGLALTGRIPKLPLVVALNYLVLSQRGNATTSTPVPDLARQVVFVTLRGEFAWGPGTPPMFGGPL